MVAPSSNSTSHEHPGHPGSAHHPGGVVEGHRDAVGPSFSPAPTPPLSDRDSALLSHLLFSNFDLPHTAAEFGLSTPELLAWLNTPVIQQTAATLLTTSQTFLEIKLTRARMSVIDTLQDIALRHDSMTERRRAASALCRRFAGAILQRTGVRPFGNPPPFTEVSPASPKPAHAHEHSSPQDSSAAPREHPSSTQADSSSSHHRRPAQPTQTVASSIRAHSYESAASAPAPDEDTLAEVTPSFSPNTIHLDGEGDECSVVLPWPMPDTPDPDPPSRLAQLLFNCFVRRDLPRLSATFCHYASAEATIDGRPLQEALPRHTLAVMYRSREVAYVERSRDPNQATYTFAFERAPLKPSRASFRFLFTRSEGDTWLIHQIDTIDTS